MSGRSSKDPTSTRELLAIVGGGLLVLVCCAGPALLAAGMLGALGGVLRNPVLAGVAGLVVAVAVGAVALRRAGHRAEQQPCCPPSANSAASDLTGPGGREGGGRAEPPDRKE